MKQLTLAEKRFNKFKHALKEWNGDNAKFLADGSVVITPGKESRMLGLNGTETHRSLQRAIDEWFPILHDGFDVE